MDDPGGSVDDPGGGNTDDVGANGDLAISTAISSKTSASFVSSSLMTGISLLSLSDKSTVWMWWRPPISKENPTFKIRVL